MLSYCCKSNIIANALLLNTLRRRDGYGYAMPSASARALAGAALALLIFATLQEPQLPRIHAVVSGCITLLTGPFIVYTMGVMSYGDRKAW